jgi:hypothetical protein
MKRCTELIVFVTLMTTLFISCSKNEMSDEDFKIICLSVSTKVMNVSTKYIKENKKKMKGMSPLSILDDFDYAYYYKEYIPIACKERGYSTDDLKNKIIKLKTTDYEFKNDFPWDWSTDVLKYF